MKKMISFLAPFTASLFFALGLMVCSFNCLGQDLTASHMDLESLTLASEATISASTGYLAPKFPTSTGHTSIKQYVAANLTYPENASTTGSSGVLLIRFQIDSNGKMGSYKILESPGVEFDNAVTSLLQNLPKWTPAVENGKAVASTQDLRLNFRLQ